MPRDAYQQSLADLRSDVVALGELVVERLDTALACLASGDVELADEVVSGDEAVNRRYLELESQCIDLLALQQPVAGDLRFVSASFKILTDIERVGDLASNVAGYATVGDRDLAPEVPLADIGRDAKDLLERSLRAYEDGDPEACRTVAERDDALDALCQRAGETVARDLVKREAGSSDAWAVEQLLDDVSRVLLTVRDLERVGDHAVNVAARTLYMVENDPELVY